MNMDTLIKQFPGGGRIARMFDFMLICEEEIKEAGLTGEKSSETFRLAQPSEFLDMAPWVYRAHVRELCRTQRLGTRAQVLLALHQASLKAPLRQDHTAAFIQVFRDCGGPEEVELVPEAWEGRNEEILQGIAQKIRNRSL